MKRKEKEKEEELEEEELEEEEQELEMLPAVIKAFSNQTIDKLKAIILSWKEVEQYSDAIEFIYRAIKDPTNKFDKFITDSIEEKDQESEHLTILKVINSRCNAQTKFQKKEDPLITQCKRVSSLDPEELATKYAESFREKIESFLQKKHEKLFYKVKTEYDSQHGLLSESSSSAAAAIQSSSSTTSSILGAAAVEEEEEAAANDNIPPPSTSVNPENAEAVINNNKLKKGRHN